MKNTLFLIAIITGVSAAGENAQSVIKKVQNKYKKTDTFTLNFNYEFKWKLTGKQQTLSGKLYFEKENHIRYELGGQLNVTDGETVWQYSVHERQVLIDNLRKNSKSMFMPKYFLYEYLDKFIAEIVKTELIGGRTFYVVRLDPRERDDFIQNMKVWIAEDVWMVEKVEYNDLEGNTISYAFTQIELDKPLSPSLFKFEVEPGMQVVDLR